MSARRHAVYGALPVAPISKIRTRKWTKKLKKIGHLTIPKWVPDQENPTEALQKGAHKKSKGRKRGPGELGRMTRSVRQHMDAPLELLSEFPVRVNTMPISPSAHASTSIPSGDGALANAANASGYPPALIHAQPHFQAAVKQVYGTTAPIELTATKLAINHALKAEAAQLTHTATATPTSTPTMPIMPAVSNRLMTEVPSDEQLEMALDDLPMLDADDSFTLDALNPAFLSTPAPIRAPPTSGHCSSGFGFSIDNSSTSVSEDDGSANSDSSMVSASPRSSPAMMSQSPSP